MTDIYSFLAEHEIEYEKHEHEPVITCEDTANLDPPVPGLIMKNLLMRDRKRKQYILAVATPEMNVDTKALGRELGVTNPSFASEEELEELLGVKPGASTVLGLVYDAQNKIQTVFDTKVWEAEEVQCHPLINTATLIITNANLQKFMKAVDHDYRVMDIPERAS